MILKIPHEQKMQAVERIRAFFAEERGEEVGSLAAEQIFDFMLDTIGPFAYNQALQDARQAVDQRMAGLEDDLYALEKQLFPNRRR